MAFMAPRKPPRRRNKKKRPRLITRNSSRTAMASGPIVRSWLKQKLFSPRNSAGPSSNTRYFSALHCATPLSEDPSRLLNSPLTLLCRQSRSDPAFPPAVHRFHIRITHLLQIVRRQRRTKTSAAIQHNLRVCVRYALFNVPLDNSFSQMHRTRQMPLRPFALFPHVHQRNFLSRIHAPLHIVHVCFFDPFLRIIHQRKKSCRVCHINLLCHSVLRKLS